MGEATLFKFGKCVDYSKSHTREEIILEMGVAAVI